MKEYIVQAYDKETIDAFDAQNAPEIVRCKNCDNVCDYSDIYKKEPFKCTLSGKFHNADWFCADGEKEGDE